MVLRIKVCPICESRNIRKSSQFDGWLIPELYVCPDCGYKGPIYMEIQIDENNIIGEDE